MSLRFSNTLVNLLKLKNNFDRKNKMSSKKSELFPPNFHSQRTRNFGMNPEKNILVVEDDDAIRMCKRYLSYLPGNAWQYPPDTVPDDDPQRMDEALLHSIPANVKRPYDMHGIVDAVVDLAL